MIDYYNTHLPSSQEIFERFSHFCEKFAIKEDKAGDVKAPKSI
jgi:hypothetical protein